jgi:hypothetical protein
MKNLATLHNAACHAVGALSLGMLGLVTAGCDDSGQATLVSRASSIDTTATASVTPIVLAPTVNVRCSTGFAFDSSFHFIVTAGIRDVTLDSVTVHLLDGSNVGGPSITIPRPELAAQSGATLIRAGSTRDFALRPAFPCIANTPQSLSASGVLLHTNGMTQTVVVAGRVR